AFVRAIGVLGSLAIVTGTVVTGAGPHAGDEKAPRLDVGIETVARIHGVSVILTLLAIVALLVRMRGKGFGRVHSHIESLLVIGVVQATVGYVQYFNDIPALLVGVHITLATAFFLAIVALWRVVAPRGVQTVEESRATVAR
ncbi:MAG: hypothetical protein ACKOJ9_11475, partial [Actinomycetota bacterium]